MHVRSTYCRLQHLLYKPAGVLFYLLEDILVILKSSDVTHHSMLSGCSFQQEFSLFSGGKIKLPF